MAWSPHTDEWSKGSRMERSPKMDEVARMLNAFPPTTDDFDLLLDTYGRQLAPVSTEAVERAVRRFLNGEVESQNKRFAPTMAEFMDEVRDSEEYLLTVARLNSERETARRQFVALPKWERDERPPFVKLMDKLRKDNSHREILAEEVTIEEYKRRATDGEFPLGSSLVAILGTVYGPNPKSGRPRRP